jgi:hypothetical protein
MPAGMIPAKPWPNSSGSLQVARAKTACAILNDRPINAETPALAAR